MTPQSESSTAWPCASLPDGWVERIFEHMSCAYGSKFSDQWGGQDPATLRAFWARKLAGFADKPHAIKAALYSLDDRPFPPTLPEFITLCRTAARRECSVPALPPPPALPRDEAAQRVGEIGAVVGRYPADGLGWANLLRGKYLAGERLTPSQISLASEALGEVWSMGTVEITQRTAT